MSPLVVLVFLFATLILYLGLTRCVIEGGLVFVRGPLIPQTFAIRSLGNRVILDGVTMTSLAFSYAWLCDMICEFMPFAANAAHLASTRKLGRKAVVQAIVLSLAVGILVSVFYTIYLGYQHGAFNWSEWAFASGAATPFRNLVSQMQNPFSPDTRRLAMMGVGAVVGGLILTARYRIPGLPLHVLGFSVASVIQVTWVMLSIFLGWLVKTVIIRLGGLQLFTKARPFFLGLVVGHLTGAGLVGILDYFLFTGQGHWLEF